MNADPALTTRTSRHEYAARAGRLMQTLAARPEERWALVCENTGHFAIGLLAALAAGKRVVLPQAARSASIEAAGAEAVISDISALQDGRHLDPADAPATGPDIEMRELEDSTALELHTSGSTGEAKRVVKQFAQLRAEIRVLEEVWGERLRGVPILATVPHYHLYGLLFRVLWPLASGRAFATSTCLHPFELKHAARQLGRCAIVSSPAFLSRLADPGDLPEVAGVAAIFSSGAPLAKRAAQWLAQRYGLPATEVYGSTETGGIAWREQGPGDSTWTLLPGVRARAGEQLAVRSPWTPAADWIDTGDRARIADNGRLHLLGRADAVLKFEDKRISLAEMANRLCEEALVSDARVVVVPGLRARLGAVVVPATPGLAETAEARRYLSRQLREALCRHYDGVLVPRKWRFVSALPENAMGKVTRQSLLALFEAGA